MNREMAIVVGAAVIIVALFGAIFIVGLQPADRSDSVTEPPDVDVPPELIESIRDDPPPPRFSDALSPGPTDVPENEALMPPEPGPNDVLEPPKEDPQGCIEMEFADPPTNVTAGEAFTLKFHEWARTPDYKGNVTNFIFITPANSSDVVAQVPLQHGEPFRNIAIEMSDGDGYAFGPVLDLSPDGETLLGYTWTPRQGAEWWLPIDMSILKPGEYVISMAAYDSTTCVRVAKDIAIDVEVRERPAGPYFTNVAANGLDVEMETNTTYNFDITADATPRYLQLLNDSLVKEPNGTSCHLNQKETVFTWRLDLDGAEASDLRYSHFLRGYFVGDPANEGFPGTRTPEPIDGGVRLTLGSAPMAHAYSAYGMGQQYWDCKTTFDDAAPWNATMECAIYFTEPGAYHGELYLVGPGNETASEKVAVSITVSAKDNVPPEKGTPAPNETAPGPAPTEPNETPSPLQETTPAPEPPVLPGPNGSNDVERPPPPPPDGKEGSSQQGNDTS